MESTGKKKRFKRDARKFIGIAKVKENGQYKCVKYRFNYPDKYLEFLQKNFQAVAWVNVFFNKGIDVGKKHSSWSNKVGWY